MVSRDELQSKFLIAAAENYISFNEDNPNVISDFLKFIDSQAEIFKNEPEKLQSLPVEIGNQLEHFEDFCTYFLIKKILDSTKYMMALVQNMYICNELECLNEKLYFKSDIKPIDSYILGCVRRYDILHGLSELGIDFNIEIEIFEKWLIKQWGLNKKPYDLNKINDLFISKIAARFNATKDELNSSGDYRYCFWVCFLEEMKLRQIDAEILLYCEGVLRINKEIFDVLDELP